eukprot:PITA_33318
MVEEYDSIVRNSVWDVVLRQKNKSVVSSHWVYKVKQAADGSVEKHKAGLVARGFLQVEGINYDETFTPVARLKQAPRAWYTRIDNYFTGLGFTKSEADANLYHIAVKGKLLIIVLYVHDLILTGDDQLIMSCKEDLVREFQMKDMGLMHYFLGMEVWQKDGELFVSQGKYANEILRRFHMEKCKPMQTPLAGSPSDRKSTSGGIFNLGSMIVSWYSRKQWLVALSSAKAEYMVVSQVACEAIWMRKILVGLFDQRMDPTVIYCDNQSCIKLSENPIFHDRSKHINIRYHHLRDCVARRIMLLQYISTEEQDANILTKALSKCKFEFHRDKIEVADNPFLIERER